MIVKAKSTEEELDEGLLENIDYFVNDFSTFSELKLSTGRTQINNELNNIEFLCSIREVDSNPYKAYYVRQIQDRYKDYYNNFIK
tara:strand:+ start:280 stop:534 length:255 start_codon:yes stop_codon:yes gene_type:complete